MTTVSEFNDKAAFELGNLNLLASQVVEGFITGQHKSPFHGFSVEFAEHRLYNTGENIKNIDWKLLARTDKYFVKRFEDETNLRCQLVIDASGSMYYPDVKDNKLRFACYSSAALMYLLKKQRDAFGLSIINANVEFDIRAKSTVAHQQLIFSKMAELLSMPAPKKATSLAESLHQLAESTPRRSMFFVFTDLMERSQGVDELFSALNHLKHRKHEVVVCNITDKRTEQDFEFDNRPHHFIDLETGSEIKLQPSAIKDNYTQAIAEYYHTIREKCTQYRIDWLEADIARGFHPVLQAYMVKRQRM